MFVTEKICHISRFPSFAVLLPVEQLCYKSVPRVIDIDDCDTRLTNLVELVDVVANLNEPLLDGDLLDALADVRQVELNDLVEHGRGVKVPGVEPADRNDALDMSRQQDNRGEGRLESVLD